jgi:16S rRNA (uracil1498-N3)-methyltransferase
LVLSDDALLTSHTPPQFFIGPEMVQGGTVILSGAALKHARAQRLSPGEVFRAVLGDTVYTATVVKTSNESIFGRGDFERQGRRRRFAGFHLFASVLKGHIFDLVVEKATEIGVHSITPVVSARTIPQLDGDKAEERRLRWQKIAKAASEQSGEVTSRRERRGTAKEGLPRSRGVYFRFKFPVIV